MMIADAQGVPVAGVDLFAAQVAHLVFFRLCNLPRLRRHIAIIRSNVRSDSHQGAHTNGLSNIGDIVP
jgi:hypothetical protein